MDFLNAMGGTAGSFFGAVIPFLFVLTVVVFVHEMGHFLVGRWCGVGVHAFSLGFGPELFGFNDRRGTRWKLCAIPLGGYVKFHGDVNGASVPDPEAVARMTPQERAISFPDPAGGQARRDRRRRAGGELHPGDPAVRRRDLARRPLRAARPGLVGGADSVAAQAGFQPGDVITAIDGEKIGDFNAMYRTVTGSAGRR